MRRRAGRSLPAAVAGAAVAALLSLPSTGSAQHQRVAALRISPIRAVFVDADRATTYSIQVESAPTGAKITYGWTLALQAVDPAVGVDAGCKNHGTLSGTDPTFVWHHGNTGDPVHDDGCDHTKQGKYGHQGLITVVVTDDRGDRCTATYKGTSSSDANSVANGVADEPACGSGESTGNTPCKCTGLTVRMTSPKLYGRTKPSPEIEFGLRWRLSCAPGDGGCHATLVAHAPQQAPNKKTGDRGYKMQFERISLGPTKFSDTEKIECKGACASATTGAVTLDVKAHSFGLVQRAHDVVPIVISRTCQGRTLPPIRLSIAFDAEGDVDLGRSRLG